MTSSSQTAVSLPERPPSPGELVHVRSRRWLVEGVRSSGAGQSFVVELACAEEDAQGERLEVYWDYEIDRRILEEEVWDSLADGRFDEPAQFAAFLHTMRWNCVTATDPTLFQSPFRAGIAIDAYQMEPLRKALRLPRVNLFIADDTGLGKTIEAGLIAQELLLRRKVKTIVVAAPPSVLEQWRAELEERFGLLFEILDRAYLARVRRDRGFGVNPWRTHNRFLVSHRLLVDEAYAAPMREWLGVSCPGSLLILDEAHHAAPASGGRYGIESKLTRAVRDLAHRFEHRLFLSATPHNGHSSSFSTLLEILDPTRFTRGVKVRGRGALEDIMIRRLKEDLRSVQGGFPKRRIERLTIDGLPEDAPELVLSRLLEEYRGAREERHAELSSRARAAEGLLVVGLQQRLLSSIEAFARSLRVHRATLDRRHEKALSESGVPPGVGTDDLLPPTDDDSLDAPGPDDDRASLSDNDLAAQEDAAVEALTETVVVEQGNGGTARSAIPSRERALLEEMEQIAEAHRHRPDAKMRRLIEWIGTHQCEGISFERDAVAEAPWNERRVIIFTENRQGTKVRLREVLAAAIEGTSLFEERIATIDGQTAGEVRREIQRRFNADPSEEPLRILLATDAAREGLNFQAHCADLFHFDLPWNPGRLEQRNGRIDRKLQPADEVRCHYFVLPQRVEDRVLEVLVRKTETIRHELGSLSKVIDDAVEKKLRGGIRHGEAESLAAQIEAEDLDERTKRTTQEELEASRERQDELKAQIETCQNLLSKSRRWTRFEPVAFRNALSCALRLQGAEPLRREETNGSRPVWQLTSLARVAEADRSWATTLDTLRAPRRPEQKLAEWRRSAPIRPVVFEDEGVLTDSTVHLHLQQRVAQRLLSRFRAQGFVHHDLSRACLVRSADAVPRVVLLGRLSLYGTRAERLHEEIIPVAARWVEIDRRETPLKAYAREAETNTLSLLERALEETGSEALPNEIHDRLQASTTRDVAELRPQLEPRAIEFAETATARLAERGEREAKALIETLTRQSKRVAEEIERDERESKQLVMDFGTQERRQYEANVRSWHERLTTFERELETEPQRIRDFYLVRARRIEPVGLVYLWPSSN